MSLYKRKDSSVWWIKIRHNGQAIQRSTGTEDKLNAQEYHDRFKTELWEQQRLGVRPTYLWNEAVVRWLKETEHKASQVSDKYHLRWLDAYLCDVSLSDINRSLIDKITVARKADGVANSTVNRVLEVVRAILRKAANEWEWLDKAPYIRLMPEPTRRIRWLTHEEATRLLAELPQHLAVMVRFSLETGLRKANVAGLQWSQLDLGRRCAWVHPDQAKARKAISVPLSNAAVVVVRGQVGKHATHVFCYRGSPIANPNNSAWDKALTRAGIENFRWHDLRHTWASWHVQAGTPLHALQELGGWESVDMVRRYAHLSSEHLANYVDRVPGLGLHVVKGGYDLATVAEKKGASLR